MSSFWSPDYVSHYHCTHIVIRTVLQGRTWVSNVDSLWKMSYDQAARIVAAFNFHVRRSLHRTRTTMVVAKGHKAHFGRQFSQKLLYPPPKSAIRAGPQLYSPPHNTSTLYPRRPVTRRGLPGRGLRLGSDPGVCGACT